MSDCANGGAAPYRRCVVKIVFRGGREIDYELPINLMNRYIDHFEVDGERFARTKLVDWDDKVVFD